MEKIDFKKFLNEEQIKACFHEKGPALVLSGAGTGKTRVLTYRICYLIINNVPSDRILALTFTNKAADEMKERIKNLIKDEAKKLWMGTFHSLGYRILREWGKIIDIPENFTVYDREDSKRILKDIVGEGESLSMWVENISKIRNGLKTPDTYEKEIAQKYIESLRKNKALDFDDLLLLLIELFKRDKNVRNYYQEKFLHILVDEYQDTSFIQYKILKILSKKHRNLFVVGDEDQSIYAFRGARVENVFDIIKDFPDIKIYRLERNYRSHEILLKAANYLISHNKGRIGKNLWTDVKEGEKIKILETKDEREEAEKVYEIIKDKNPSDVLILYRTNAQSRPLEEIFNLKKVPYQVVGALKFFERREIKDFISYLKFIVNPYDYVSFERLIESPRRGIGEVTQKKLKKIAEKKEISILDAMKEGEFLKSLSTNLKKEIKKLTELFDYIRFNLENLTCLEIAEKIYEEVEFIKHLKKISTDNLNFESRYENLMELFASMREFVLKEEKPSLTNYLQNVVLRIDEENIEKDIFTLMTVHNAKGLEAETVIITGLEEGLFPHFLSLENDREIEEERRLFYVALTRAKKEVYLLYSRERWRKGTRETLPSRFLYELPESCVEWVKKEEFIKKEEKILKRGDRVYHPFWGEGIVLDLGDGKAKINFFRRGVITLVLRKVQGLKKLYLDE
ncbi:MAG: UvrD-helicase domain-containing protein [candidate division WOR-3 bacterium]